MPSFAALSPDVESGGGLFRNEKNGIQSKGDRDQHSLGHSA
jgi:hypothetical protein